MTEAVKCCIGRCQQSAEYTTLRLCRRHYDRKSRYGDPNGGPQVKRATPCKVDGCRRNYYGLGFCNPHYIRFRKYGDPMGGRPSPEKTWIVPPSPTGLCGVRDCTKPCLARGACRQHYMLWKRGTKLKSSKLRWRTKPGWTVYKQRHIWFRYGLTIEAYEAILKGQDGCCAICRTVDGLIVDHCHSTGAVRGILCQKCNICLGSVDDTIWRLERAITYLQKSQDIVQGLKDELTVVIP